MWYELNSLIRTKNETVLYLFSPEPSQNVNMCDYNLACIHRRIRYTPEIKLLVFFRLNTNNNLLFSYIKCCCSQITQRFRRQIGGCIRVVLVLHNSINPKSSNFVGKCVKFITHVKFTNILELKNVVDGIIFQTNIASHVCSIPLKKKKRNRSLKLLVLISIEYKVES